MNDVYNTQNRLEVLKVPGQPRAMIKHWNLTTLANNYEILKQVEHSSICGTVLRNIMFPRCHRIAY